MLERNSVVLDNRQGTTRQAIASRPGIVYCELLADCPQRLAVLITLRLSLFTPDDYLVEVTTGPEGKSIRTLRGTTPYWAASPELVPADAFLVASPESF